MSSNKKQEMEPEIDTEPNPGQVEENLEPSRPEQHKRRDGRESPQALLDKLIKLFWGNNPHVKDVQKTMN